MWLGKRRRGAHVCEDGGFVHVLSRAGKSDMWQLVSDGRNGRKHILVDVGTTSAGRRELSADALMAGDGVGATGKGRKDVPAQDCGRTSTCPLPQH
jgi:hypothetical protein